MVDVRQVPLLRLSNWNYESDKCRFEEEGRRQQDTMQHCFESSQSTINVNVYPLEHAADFPYLVRKVVFNNSNWANLYHNLWKERRH